MYIRTSIQYTVMPTIAVVIKFKVGILEKESHLSVDFRSI